MQYVFYVRLIALTAGTLVYLFLLALILGHRRPRLLERLLFLLSLSTFLMYAGGLLEINSSIQYGSPPDSTRFIYKLLDQLGISFLPALLIHFHFAYIRTIQGRRIPKWCRAVVALFYVLPFLNVLGTAYVLHGLGALRISDLSSWLAAGAARLVIPAVLAGVACDFDLSNHSKDPVERKFFVSLGILLSLIFVPIALRTGFAAFPPMTEVAYRPRS